MRTSSTVLATVAGVASFSHAHFGPHHWGPPSSTWPPHDNGNPYGGQDASNGSQQSCEALTAQQISSMGNNSLFTRWRPRSHVLAPAGWMNDPCGLMYDPTRDVYHVSYQWHPEHFNWGNISWGAATSKDLITWTDHDGWRATDARIHGPSGNGSYNGLGIFSGTAQPVNLQGVVDGTLLHFYTSVGHLPTSWSIPYQPYTETQSIAISEDGGKTWRDYEHNPVINATTGTGPMHWNITGFRDPFVLPWPEMDTVLGVSEPHFYAVFGSGIKGVGPRMPFWTAPASDLTKWTFLAALWEPAANTSLGPVLSTGTYAFNFEVSGFFSLPDSTGKPHFFVNMGSEGGNVSFHESAHWSLWNEGTVSRRPNGSAEFQPISGGAGDWGLAYALSSFNDTKHNRRVQYAWAPEDLVDDAGLFSAPQQGFQGSLTLPRELFVHETPNVVDSDGSLAASKSAVLRPSSNHTLTAQTLGVRPLPDVVAGLRAPAAHHAYPGRTYNTTTLLSPTGHAQMELHATFTLPSSQSSNSTSDSAVGVVIASSPDGHEHTTIAYHPNNHTIIVDRARSSTIKGFATSAVTGYLRPYQLADERGSRSETLDMTVFVDGSLVEVYVNGRFALTTRVYPSMRCSTGFGVYVESGGEGREVEVGVVEAWLGLLNVWPERPADTSSALKFDTAVETNNYTWWSGN